MRKTRLGRNGPEVTELCLGTMTWGTQTPETDAHAQIDLARDRGVNFMDTAEMYPVNPVREETVGRTEEIIGNWVAKGGRRSDWIIATKIGGHGGKARGGEPITGPAIRRALEASLRRLRTEHIDIYQFHWPNRSVYHFRKIWNYDPGCIGPEATEAHMIEALETLKALIAEGKIGHFGLSNETAWGMAQWLRLAEAGHGPRAISVQNEYSLMCRTYDSDMGELGRHEALTLLAFSPLAAGLLTGKYAGGSVPYGSRKSIVPDLSGRATGRAEGTVAAYHAVAAKHRIDPVQMAIAWTLTRPFPVVPILGASSVSQLERALGADGMKLSAEVLADIATAYKAHPMPY